MDTREPLDGAPSERELRQEFDIEEDCEELLNLDDCAGDEPYEGDDEARDAYYGDLGIK